MRENKFRAWDTEFKRMKVTGMGINHGVLDGENVIIMQYTGLKDSTKWEQLSESEKQEWLNSGKTKEEWNGREIYEGDIVNVDDVGNGVVIYGLHRIAEDSWGVPIGTVGYSIEWDDGSGCSGLLGSDHEKVIGNIYENPELIAGGDK